MTRTPASWMAWGTIVVAAVAAVALGITVATAYGGFRAAAGTLARGEGEILLAAVQDAVRDQPGPPSAEALARVVAARAGAGLLCAALVGGRERFALVTGDREACATGALRPGELEFDGEVARLATLLQPPPVRPRPAPFDEPDDPPPPGPPPPGARPPGPPMIIIAFSPPVTASLHAAIDRTAWVGGAAVALLLALAGLTTRGASQRDAEGREAERQRRLASLGEMSSVMAHELRNPLASLKGHAQLLLESVEAARDRAMAERVVHEAERLERLTGDLLDFVRDGPIDRAAADPAALVARAAALVPGAVVRIDARTAPRAASVDETRLVGALANLIRNAHQAAGDQPIEARVATEGEDLVIEIRDRGPGLAPGEEARIFEPFVTSRVRGTGLGLAVARRAAEQHGGTLVGETHPAGGAVFRLVLPGSARPMKSGRPSTSPPGPLAS